MSRSPAQASSGELRWARVLMSRSSHLHGLSVALSESPPLANLSHVTVLINNYDALFTSVNNNSGWQIIIFHLQFAKILFLHGQKSHGLDFEQLLDEFRDGNALISAFALCSLLANDCRGPEVASCRCEVVCRVKVASKGPVFSKMLFCSGH